MGIINSAKQLTLGGVYSIASHFAKRLYSDNLFYLLRRDLSLPTVAIDTDLSLSLREFRADDVHEFLDSILAKNETDGALDRLRLLYMVMSGIKTGYVVVGDDDRPCHVCWLIDSKQNNKLQNMFRGGIPPLRPDEVVLEGFFTIERFRRQGIQNWSISKLIEKSKAMGAKLAYIYIRQPRISSVKAAMKNNFMPFMMRKDKWRVFHRKFDYVMIDNKNPYQGLTIIPGYHVDHELSSDRVQNVFKSSLQQTWYACKPFLPRSMQIMMRRRFVAWKRLIYNDIWPIDRNAGKYPVNWPGWPEGKQFAFVLTHDVETMKGHNKCERTMEIEERYDMRSSFNFVPGGYPVSPSLRDYITSKGFEVGVHGLTHRGNLFATQRTFQGQVDLINHYLREWSVVGFRTPAMYHNLDWIKDINIEYDASTFDTDPFEPQSDGVGTIFPFWVSGDGPGTGYVELPYTLVQDFTLFILMKEKNIDIWKRKLDWVAENGGMVLLITHPDYMNFGDSKLKVDEYPTKYYTELIEYVKAKYEGKYWHALPRDIASHLAKNIRLKTS